MRSLKIKSIFSKLIITVLLCTTITLIIVSCRHTVPPVPYCTKKYNSQIDIRWGVYITKTGEFHGYKLNSNAELFKYGYDIVKKKNFENRIDYIDSIKYCNSISEFKKLIMKYQALNIPADTVKYMEYNDPTTNVKFRAVWNPNNKTKANDEFVDFYDMMEETAKGYDK